MTTNAGKEIRKGETSYTIGVICQLVEPLRKSTESPREPKADRSTI